jgi:hypothetical protein
MPMARRVTDPPDALDRPGGCLSRRPMAQRPLGIAALEDKIVQAAAVMILSPIYEGNDESVRE